jgi:L,D-transpeptidase catalytic domain
MDGVLTRLFALLPLLFVTAPAIAQDGAPPPIVFSRGTGEGLAVPAPTVPMRPEIGCGALALSQKAIDYGYYSSAGTGQRLDRTLFGVALSNYRDYYCSYGRSAGPALIVIVDFARRSSEPRLYRVDLRNGDGLDSPIRVAHGIGSDPNDDGIVDVLGNVQDSLMSSLGAARGGEIYVGINGLSLRLDGLEPSNNAMRARDIVVHSYTPTLQRYFNAELLAMRGGRPGTSEGCFVVEPDKRDWLMQTLENGGFLYSGYSGQLPNRVIAPPQNVTFARGTGATPVAAPVRASGTPAGTPGIPPTAPISPAPAAPGQ